MVLAQLFNEVDFTKITTILKNILKICILEFSSSSRVRVEIVVTSHTLFLIGNTG